MDKKFSLWLIILSCLLFAVNTKAGVIFEDNFDQKDDWWPRYSRPVGTCVDGQHATKCNVPGWTNWRNDEMWNPYDDSGSTAPVIGSHPTIQISGEQHYGTTGKAYIQWNESNNGWSGDGWGADGILGKVFDSDYRELYVQYKMKFQPNFKRHWKPAFMASSLKTFRMGHFDRIGSPFQGFSTGNLSMEMLFNVNENEYAPFGQAGGQFRCDPQNGDYVNYNNQSYFCIKDNDASQVLPDNTSYWQAVAYNPSYNAWQPDKQYWKSNYYCGQGGSINGGSFFVDVLGNQVNGWAANIAPSTDDQLLGIYDGNWHTIEHRVMVNSLPGIADGIYQYWYDGNLLVNKSDVMWIGNGGSADIGLNWVAIGGNAFNNFAEITNTTYQMGAEQWYAIDDVVVSTSQISNNYVIGGSAKYSFSDFSSSILNWLHIGPGNSSDINSDSIVNAKDLGIMMSKWN